MLNEDFKWNDANSKSDTYDLYRIGCLVLLELYGVAEPSLREPIHSLLLLSYGIIGCVLIDFLLHYYFISILRSDGSLIHCGPIGINFINFAGVLAAVLRRAISLDLDMLVLVVHLDFI